MATLLDLGPITAVLLIACAIAIGYLLGARRVFNHLKPAIVDLQTANRNAESVIGGWKTGYDALMDTYQKTHSELVAERLRLQMVTAQRDKLLKERNIEIIDELRERRKDGL